MDAVEHQVSNGDYEKSQTAYVTETNAASAALGACEVYSTALRRRRLVPNSVQLPPSRRKSLHFAQSP